MLCIFITFKARKNGDWVLLWIMAIISVQCMIEHHMLDIVYNGFLLCALSDIYIRENKVDSGVKKFWRKYSRGCLCAKNKVDNNLKNKRV